MPLKRATLAEQAYEELRARIVSGALEAGRRLLADELAADLAISQTPVKEALALLERDGLVEGNARRASTVRRFQAGDVRQIYEARAVLEIHAIRRGWERGAITREAIAVIEEIFARQLAHAKRHRPVVFAQAVKLDCEFHEALIALAANPVVTDWHRGVLAQTMTILTYSMETFDAKRAHVEHEAILAALNSFNPAAMEAALRAHLQAACAAAIMRTPALANPAPSSGGRDAA